MPSVIKAKQSIPLSLMEFYEKHKKILIRRNLGGLGDIFMHRMIFEDFKHLMPECHLTFACPEQYFDAVFDHPWIDKVVDSKYVNENEFFITYNTTEACREYELEHAPNINKHRSDIWANHCGVELKRHDMCFRLSEKEINWGKNFLGKIANHKKIVMIAPISAMSSKNLTPEQIQPVIDTLSKDYFVFGLHDNKLHNYNIVNIKASSIRQFISLINASDYAITADTAAFHCAGGLQKPIVGVFGWADGKVYSKYYSKSIIVQKHRDDDPLWTCGPCFKFTSCCKVDKSITRKPCITEITSNMILDGFNKMVSIY